MADLSDPPRSRGQILLITALVLGVSFVALALILNSAIFTENLASRGDTTGADEVVTYHNNLERGIGGVVAYETRNASTEDTHDEVFRRIVTGVADADDVTVRRYARRGAVTNVSIVDGTNGTRVFQTDSSRNFTDGNHEADWTVAADVTGTRAFRLNVTEHVGTDRFVVTIGDGSDRWNLSVAESGGDLEVLVDNGTGSEQSCGIESGSLDVDLTAGTVAGTSCGALSFAEVPGGSYDVGFVNGSEVEGTYTLVVDDETIAGSGTPPHFAVGPNPAVSPAVYDLTLRYQYRTSDVVVEQEIGVAPGELDGR